jgi:hypothetical protein
MTILISTYLVKKVLLNSYVSILYYSEESLLVIRWKRQITFKERKDGFLWAYWFSCSHAVKNWLIDDEEIFHISPAEKEWVTNTWTKLVATSEIRKIAVVTPVHLPGLMANTQFTESAQKQYKAFGHTRHEVFTDYDLALAWFKEDL